MYIYLLFIYAFLIFSILLSFFLYFRIKRITRHLKQFGEIVKVKNNNSITDVNPTNRFPINPIVRSQKSCFIPLLIGLPKMNQGDKYFQLKADYNLRLSTVFKVIGRNDV